MVNQVTHCHANVYLPADGNLAVMQEMLVCIYPHILLTPARMVILASDLNANCSWAPRLLLGLQTRDAEGAAGNTGTGIHRVCVVEHVWEGVSPFCPDHSRYILGLQTRDAEGAAGNAGTGIHRVRVVEHVWEGVSPEHRAYSWVSAQRMGCPLR